MGTISYLFLIFFLYTIELGKDTMSKTPSEQLREKLIELTSESTAKKTFSISDIESKAKKVRDTFEDEVRDEYIQHRGAIKV